MDDPVIVELMDLYVEAALAVNGLPVPEDSTAALGQVAMLVSMGKAMDFESWRAVMTDFNPDYEKKVIINGVDVTGYPPFPPGTQIGDDPIPEELLTDG